MRTVFIITMLSLMLSITATALAADAKSVCTKDGSEVAAADKDACDKAGGTWGVKKKDDAAASDDTTTKRKSGDSGGW